MQASNSTAADAAFELRFESLFDAGRGFAFPCDRSGRVARTGLRERTWRSYLAVLERVGRDFSAPVVCAAAAH
ncbi:hypothetical protein [Caldimonas sp. KR1-144]|uniref:hypothetical protein n=1 Tax=Caldimonas sp. KR1-144 TaxID=3400911 RepID=UPI003C0D694B